MTPVLKILQWFPSLLTNKLPESSEYNLASHNSRVHCLLLLAPYSLPFLLILLQPHWLPCWLSSNTPGMILLWIPFTNQIFPLSGMFFSDIGMTNSLTSFKTWLKCQFLKVPILIILLTTINCFPIATILLYVQCTLPCSTTY